MRYYDEKHNRWIHHRQTTEYRQRKRRLRDYWTAGLLIALPLPPGFIFGLVLFGLFLSLSYLDETPYRTPRD